MTDYEEHELDEDDECIILKWNLLINGGKKAAAVGYAIENKMEVTAREVLSTRNGKSMDDIYDEVIEIVEEFMCLDENSEHGASDTEPRDVLRYYVQDTLKELEESEKVEEAP